MNILNSWKEIAAYVGRGVRTVQRWERDFGLPVHRPKGTDRSAVLAFPEEVDVWLHHTPARSQVSADNGDQYSSVALPDAQARMRASMCDVQRSLTQARELRAQLVENVQRHHAATATLHASMEKMTRRERSRRMTA